MNPGDLYAYLVALLLLLAAVRAYRSGMRR